jgi:hypothetical protein
MIALEAGGTVAARHSNEECIMKRAVLTIGVILAGATAASASGYYDPIDRREHNQERRIERGVHDGSLTRREYYRLEAEQSRIRAMEARARRDGYVSPYERYQLRRAQDEASRHIYEERHDRDGWGWRRWW